MAVVLCLFLAAPASAANGGETVAGREAFVRAWEAARRGDRAEFEHLLPGQESYLLFPYLRYEDLRHRRTRVDEGEMAAFLAAHRDWAFAPALETAWLRSLGDRGRWDSVLEYGGESEDTEVRCHHAHARIQRGQLDGLLAIAQQLWTAGRSQPDACDAVFSWLQKRGGISSGLAWERIRLAMQARERTLARYLARFLDPADRAWADRWQGQDRGAYRQLRKAARWPDGPRAHDITEYGLKRLARNHPDPAWEAFQALDGVIRWPGDRRDGILAELALWSAVDRSPGTEERMRAVPDGARDDRLLEWLARYRIAGGDWPGVAGAIDSMSPGLQDDSRWRYWAARSRGETGLDDEASERMERLAGRANFYGFMAADALQLPYNICPEDPSVAQQDLDAFLAREGVDRALELHRAGLSGWARSEWKRALRGTDRAGLRAAAAVARRENWHDMTIAALGNSGDLSWYEWRFPLGYRPLAEAQAQRQGLDPSWVLGLMRSESALAEDAVSHAGALGLMQLTPGTARKLSRSHSMPYPGRAGLLEAEINVRFGTAYLHDLLERFDGNPVLASAAYNAGPNAVDRWLADGYTDDPAAWIETLPYFETRDYIPRVLAFSTLYQWRFGQPVRRLSSRMPTIGGQAATADATAGVVCRQAD